MTTTAADSQIVPRPPDAAPALRAADQGVADALEACSPKTSAASTAPSGESSPTGVATWAYAPCRQSPSPWPAT